MKGLLTYGYRDPRRPTQMAGLRQPAPNLTNPLVFGSITRDALGVQRGFFNTLVSSRKSEGHLRLTANLWIAVCCTFLCTLTAKTA
jgi:hypothetical protein